MTSSTGNLLSNFFSFLLLKVFMIKLLKVWLQRLRPYLRYKCGYRTTLVSLIVLYHLTLFNKSESYHFN
jgi:hypothetical protein